MSEVSVLFRNRLVGFGSGGQDDGLPACGWAGSGDRTRYRAGGTPAKEGRAWFAPNICNRLFSTTVFLVQKLGTTVTAISE
ncbi:hypothetical protein [Haladaptatus pallidirubidus]|uniref:hypothetical protein n=1 Tax=Haladaptatus pallidirubidus TaxID=1008152 RepID=UPI001D119B9D|nr:hypothetical protein [Haladaptatus pallidirubidus]